MKKEKSHARDPQKINFSIAIHRSLCTELTRWGEDEGRNRNAQIAWVLRQAVEAHKLKSHEEYAAALTSKSHALAPRRMNGDAPPQQDQRSA